MAYRSIVVHTGRQIGPRIVAMLLLIVAGTAAIAGGNDGRARQPCHIVLGPTSEAALNQANEALANLLAARLLGHNFDCRVEVFSAWPRAQQIFGERQNAALFPEIEYEQIDGTMTGMPVAATGGFVVVTRAGNKLYHRIEDLGGLTVGTIRGRFYPDALAHTADIKQDAAGSLQQNINKVLSGRLDATLEYLTDIEALMTNPEYATALQYGDEFGNTNLAFRFKHTAEGESLRKHFDNAIIELINDGSYQKIYATTRLKMLY